MADIRKMKIALGADHRGFCFKNRIIKYLTDKGIEVIDCGADSEERADYSEFGIKTAKEVSSGNATFGTLICNTGNGMAIAANKVKSIRAGLALNPEMAKLARAHNNANVLVLSELFTDEKLLFETVDIFLSTDFEGGRHKKSVEIITNYEESN